MSEKGKTIGFRLDQKRLSRLEDLAEAAGVTIHEFARQALTERLDSESDVHRLTMNVTNIQSELSELRRDLAVSVEALLVTSGVTHSEAKAFTDENLRTKK
jgi:hypothetical protein